MSSSDNRSDPSLCDVCCMALSARIARAWRNAMISDSTVSSVTGDKMAIGLPLEVTTTSCALDNHSPIRRVCVLRSLTVIIRTLHTSVYTLWHTFVIYTPTTFWFQRMNPFNFASAPSGIQTVGYLTTTHWRQVNPMPNQPRNPTSFVREHPDTKTGRWRSSDYRPGSRKPCATANLRALKTASPTPRTYCARVVLLNGFSETLRRMKRQNRPTFGANANCHHFA